MTRYVILKRQIEQGAEGESWVVVGEPVDAQTDIAALKAAVKATQIDLSNGAVAVPVRNWRPRKPERKVTESTLWN